MITLRQLRLLSEAVSEAETWRGNLVGAAPDYAIEAFDAKIKKMRMAVRAARKDREQLSALLKPTCASCGTHEVSLDQTCHNSSCELYASEISRYRGWEK